MTDELQTLKDLKIYNFGWKLPENISLDGVSIIDLRQLAIKWVKDGDLSDTYDTWFYKFKTFFNITEEDLK